MAQRRSNGEGTVRKNLERARWEGRITIGHDANKRPIRRMVTGPTKASVLERMRDATTAANAGMNPARRDHTVGRFLDEWLTDVLPGSVALATEVQYRAIVSLYIKPHVGRKKLSTLSARDVTVMLNRLAADGYSPTTRRLARAVLRRALRYAEQEGLISRNAAAIADGVRLDRVEGRTMTPAEARVFLGAIDGDRLEAAFVVALSCGLRLGELLGLAWSSVDLDGTTPKLTVRQGLKRIPKAGLVLEEQVKTKGSRRVIHLPPPVVAHLRAHRKRQRAERLVAGADWVHRPVGADLVFRTPRGTAIDPSNFWSALSAATTAAGLGHWHAHELRHSAASLMLAQGVPLKLVSEALGHSSIAITADIYAHVLDESRAVAAGAMAEVLWGSA